MTRAGAARTKKRREKRVMKSAGVAAMHRIVIENSAISAALAKGASLSDFLALQVSTGLDELVGQGADMLDRVVVTIGRHPDYPNALTVEAKAASVLADERDDAGQ